MNRTLIAGLTALVAACVVNPVAALAESAPLTCMEPTILDANPNPAFDLLPSVFEAPSAGSKKIGIATSIIYALSPTNEVSGFIEVVHPNGVRGWVQANAIEPWHNVNTPAARCTARLLPNGRPHATYS